MVMKIKRNIFRLAQSPALRHVAIDPALIGIGFTPTASDPCVYTYGCDETLTILTRYVDGILLSEYHQKVLQRLKALIDRFVMADMVDVSIILGMSVSRDYDKGALNISQADYLQNVLERFGILECNTVKTPGYGPKLSNANSRRKSY